MAVAAVRLCLPVVLVCRARRGADPHELLVDLRGGQTRPIVEQRQQVVTDEDVLFERHGTDLGDDDLGIAAHRVQPVAELLRVRHRRAQRHQADAGGEVDDDLFPDRSTESVSEVVHLVHDHVAQIPQRRRVGVDHVAQDLCRHDDDPRIAVDVGVAGEQAHLIGPVDVDQLAELLVRQCLHRRRVEGLVARCLHREMDRELADDRLACTCRSSDQHASSTLECMTARDLERVEIELLQRRERR